MSFPLATPSELHVDEMPIAVHRECRVHERFFCGVASKCQPASSFGKDELKWAGVIENVSIGGIGLVLTRRFETGTGLAIELPGSDGNEPYVVLARVIHVANRNGAWLLGCKFVSELSEEEVRRLLPSTTPPVEPVVEPVVAPAAETEPACNAKTRRVQVVIETTQGKTVRALIPQFGTKSAWPLAAGQIGTLQGINRRREAWKLRVQVRACRLENETWTLECRQANAIPEAELHKALFGLLLRN
jgi:hypothetical protein